MNENQISRIVFDAGLKVHKKLGPGLLESVYEQCLALELGKKGLNVQRQYSLPLIYEDTLIQTSYRLDLFIENKFIVELKTVDELSDLHMAQLLTYLKISNCKLGLLINFNSLLFKNGVRRVINGHLEYDKYRQGN